MALLSYGGLTASDLPYNPNQEAVLSPGRPFDLRSAVVPEWEGSGPHFTKFWWVQRTRSIRVFWVFALVATLLSYSLDLECLLLSSGCSQTCQVLSDDDCTAPAVGISPAILPTPLVLKAPPCRPLARTLAPRTVRRWHYDGADRCLPLGLRAPPLCS